MKMKTTPQERYGLSRVILEGCSEVMVDLVARMRSKYPPPDADVLKEIDAMTAQLARAQVILRSNE